MSNPSDPIRVLIVDDSPTARELLVSIMSSSPDFTVVGAVENGADAVERAIALSPDLILMDVNMPIMDGLDATKEIMREAPTPIVMVSASTSGPDNDVSLGLSATQAGALMLIPKPYSPSSPNFETQREQLLKMAKAMAAVKVVRRWGSRTTPIAVPAARRARQDGQRRLVAIGTSTGGPAALQRILGNVPRDFPAPILVVQHMALGFIDGLAKWLAGNIQLGVTVANHGMKLLPGTVYIAPDDAHLGVTADAQAVLSRVAPLGGFRPSADFLFDSCARAYGSAAVGVILTGMGSDGVEGLKTLHARGGRIIAQDEQSSVVFGMAQQAIAAGIVDEVLPVERIAMRLVELVEASV